MVKRLMVVLGVATVGALVFGCGGGGGAGTPVGECLMSGMYTGSGACGVASFTFDDTSGVASGFGTNASVTFTVNGSAAEATGVMILGAPNHTCELTCGSNGTVKLHCTNANGGMCDSTFTEL